MRRGLLLPESACYTFSSHSGFIWMSSSYISVTIRFNCDSTMLEYDSNEILNDRSKLTTINDSSTSRHAAFAVSMQCHCEAQADLSPDPTHTTASKVTNAERSNACPALPVQTWQLTVIGAAPANRLWLLLALPRQLGRTLVLPGRFTYAELQVAVAASRSRLEHSVAPFNLFIRSTPCAASFY